MSTAGTGGCVINGINHLVLVCRDMDRTLRFYCGVLGLKVKLSMGPSDAQFAARPDARGRRFYWLEAGNGDVFAFFEVPNADVTGPPTMYPELWPGDRPPASPPRGMDHLALNVDSVAELDALRERLAAHNVPFSSFRSRDPIPIHSVYFYDPDEVAIEVASWDVGSPEWRRRRDEDAFQDRSPPPSLAENPGWKLQSPYRRQRGA